MRANYHQHISMAWYMHLRKTRMISHERYKSNIVTVLKIKTGSLGVPYATLSFSIPLMNCPSWRSWRKVLIVVLVDGYVRYRSSLGECNVNHYSLNIIDPFYLYSDYKHEAPHNHVEPTHLHNTTSSASTNSMDNLQ